jgi:hypothetical protein
VSPGAARIFAKIRAAPFLFLLERIMKLMKRNLLVPVLAAVLLTATTLPSIAAMSRVDLLGSSSSSSAASSTIVVTPGTEYVTVKRGDIVNFVVGDKGFTWDFNGGDNVSSFDLSQVAPPGVLDHAVTAYVNPDPLGPYGGGGR